MSWVQRIAPLQQAMHFMQVGQSFVPFHFTCATATNKQLTQYVALRMQCSDDCIANVGVFCRALEYSREQNVIPEAHLPEKVHHDVFDLLLHIR